MEPPPPRHPLAEAIGRKDWQEVQKQCERNPQEARTWHLEKGFFQGTIDSDVLPLHQAVASVPAPPVDVIATLLEAYPNAVAAKEATLHRTPLHLACQRADTSTDAILLLLEHAPKAATKHDSLGRHALHYACSSGASVEVVNALLDAYPQAVSIRDVNGWLPIHVACRSGACFRVVQRLLDAAPESIVAETTDGNTTVDMMVCQKVIGNQSDFLSDAKVRYMMGMNEKGI